MPHTNKVESIKEQMNDNRSSYNVRKATFERSKKETIALRNEVGKII